MKRDDMKAVLATVGRYVRQAFEPRIKAIEEQVGAIPALLEKSLDVEAVAADAARRLLASDGLKGICDLVAAEAVAALPPAEPGQDGKSVTVDEVLAALLPRLQAHVDAEVAKAVLDVERRAQGVLERAVAAIPKAKDGQDGRDGLGFEDMSASYDGEREVTLKFQRGELVKEFTLSLPVVIDRGYWREGTAAKAGDGWTHDGTWWIAQRDTKAAPALDSADWRIGARKGRDGKQGEAGKNYAPPAPVKLS